LYRSGGKVYLTRRLLPYYVPHEPIAHAKAAKVGKGIEEVGKCEGENGVLKLEA
jgi:hypothetical protein